MLQVSAEGGRWFNAVAFFIYSFIIFGFMKWGTALSDIFPIADYSCGTDCYRYYAVYRVGLGLALYHLLQSIILIGVKDTSDVRASIQQGFWPVKALVLLATIFLSFYIPVSFINLVYVPCMIIGVLFLLIQAILLVDLAYNVAERLVEKAEEGNGFHKFLLIGSTLFFNLGAIASVIFVFYYFESTLERVLISVNAILIVVITVCSLLPSVQEANPSSGIFQSGLLGLYSLFVILGAFITNPEHSKGAASAALPYPVLSYIVAAASVIFVFLTIARNAMNVGVNLHLMDPNTKNSFDNDEESAGRYNYSLFHLSFFMGAIYTILYVTFWKQAVVTEPGKVITILDYSWGYWVRVISSWVVNILYLWSLFAPVIFKERSF